MVSVMLKQILLNKNCRKLVFKMTTYLEKEHINQKLYQNFGFIMDSLSVYTAYVDAKTLQYLFVNKIYTQTYNLPREKIIGAKMQDILSEANYAHALPYIKAAQKGTATSYEYFFNVPIGLRWVKVDYIPEFDANDNVIAFVVMGTDITDRKLAEEKVRKSEIRYRFIVETASEGIMVLNKNFIIEYTNNKLASMLKCENNWLLGKSFRDLLFDKDLPNFELQVIERMRGEGATYEKYLKTKNGTGHWSLISAKPIMDDSNKFDGIFIMLTDIHSRKKLERKLEQAIKKLKRLSNTDELTGLVNRRYFNKTTIGNYIKLSGQQEKLAFIMLDIDQFKEFNDYYGHLQGDVCLQKVAKVLAKNINGKFSIVSRYGGDEFLCLVSEQNLTELAIIAGNIVKNVEALHVEHVKSKISPYVTISLGIASITCNGDLDITNCIKYADEALYEAKKLGRNTFVIRTYKNLQGEYTLFDN